MTTAIKIENVSKLYRLGTVGTGTIAHDLNRWWHTIRGKEDPYAKVGQVNDRTKRAASDEKREASIDSATPSPLASSNSQLSSPSPLATRHSPLATSPDYVWALKDINLEVAQGEILGIIGRNGAGKSTLLKLLSRVTAPTTGSIKTKGRIASLLEVGTGFHPELTGKENIYVNGAILGMRRHEITRQLDEIIEFSGCSRYIDTPVKRYSSGMYVRLAFAVAAHLQCEILIVDEVLAVGDADFQRKCMGKMRQLSSGGRTVLLVSHNLASIESLSTDAMWMDLGVVRERCRPAQLISKYLAVDLGADNGAFRPDPILQSFKITNTSTVQSAVIRIGDSVRFEATIMPPRSLSRASFGIGILTERGERIITLHTDYQYQEQIAVSGAVQLVADWSECCLLPGKYKLMAALYDGLDPVETWGSVTDLIVEAADYFGTGKLPETSSQGWIAANASWTVKKVL